MGTPCSRPTPPLIEVRGPHSKILIPAGSSFDFYAPDRHHHTSHAHAHPQRCSAPPCLGRRYHSSSSVSSDFDSELGPDSDSLPIPRRGRGRGLERLAGRYRRLDSPELAPGFVDMRGMRRGARRRAFAGGWGGGFRGMDGGLVNDDYGRMGMGSRPYDSAPDMGPEYDYPGMGIGTWQPRAGLRGTGAGPAGGGGGFGGFDGMVSDPNNVYAQPYPQTGVPYEQHQSGIPFQPQPQVLPSPQNRRRRAQVPPASVEPVIIDGAHEAAFPRRARSSRGHTSPGKDRERGNNAANEFPREWQEGDPFLDACVCPVGCECRTGRRVGFRMKTNEGKMQSGTIRYEAGHRDGKPCRNGCTGHGASDNTTSRRKNCTKDTSDAGEDCAAVRTESKNGLAKLNRKFRRMEAMMQHMGVAGPEISDNPMMTGRMPARMSSDPLMGGVPSAHMDPYMQAAMAPMAPRRSMTDPRMRGVGDPMMMGMQPGARMADMDMGMPGMSGYHADTPFNGFGMDPAMAGMGMETDMMAPMMGRIPPPGFMYDDNARHQRGGRRRRRGSGFGLGRPRRPDPGPGRRRQMDFEDDDTDTMGMDGESGPDDGFDEIDPDSEWQTAGDDDFEDDLEGRRRASPAGRGRRRGGRQGLGRHMSGRGRSARQPHVEDDDQADI